MTDPGDKAHAAPNLNHVIIEKRPGLLDSFAIIEADESLTVSKMIVDSDEIRSVFCHPQSHYRMTKSYA